MSSAGLVATLHVAGFDCRIASREIKEWTTRGAYVAVLDTARARCLIQPASSRPRLPLAAGEDVYRIVIWVTRPLRC